MRSSIVEVLNGECRGHGCVLVRDEDISLLS